MRRRRVVRFQISDRLAETLAGVFTVFVIGLLIFMPLFIGQNPWR